MADDTNPPVGATVEGYPRKGIQVLRHDEKGEARWGFLLADEDGETPIESCFTDHAAITLAWRMQQRAEQAEAELAKLRALAVEASSRPNLPPESTMAEAHGLTLHWYAGVIDRLAALATPNQENTP